MVRDGRVTSLLGKPLGALLVPACARAAGHPIASTCTSRRRQCAPIGWINPALTASRDATDSCPASCHGPEWFTKDEPSAHVERLQEQAHPQMVSRSKRGDTAMFSKTTLSAVLIAIVATTSSAALAASKTTRHNNGRTAHAAVLVNNMSGAEWFQNKGIAEEMGLTYWGR